MFEFPVLASPAPRHACRVARALCAASLLCSSITLAQTGIDFPMDVARRDGPLGSFEYTPRPAEFADLLELAAVQMTGVELPSGGVVGLDLTRIDFDFTKLGVHVDGKEMRAWDPQDLSLWKGQVAGDPWSEVMLGFASGGCYGWISTAGETWHLSAYAGTNGDWTAPGCRMWAESISDAVRGPEERFLCLSDRVARNVRQMAGQAPSGWAPSGQAPGGGQSNANGSLSECKVAVETDYQLYQVFGSLSAEQTYMAQLLGAISDRYETEVDVVLTYPYLMFHTNPNDGWTTAETGGNAGDMLQEFRAAWSGNIPGGAHLAHFISGASLGGGVAYVDVLCNSSFGFAVSANIGASVNFPVSQGSGNWDFIVISHELGHNFSSPHTHNYCPPLDNCAPSGYFGQCQTSQQCSNQGTLMSYCHLCSGGTSNITTYFHPTVVAQIRGAVAASCLPPYMGGGGGCQDDAAEPNDTCGNGTSLAPGFSGGYIAKDDNLDVFAVRIPLGGTVTFDVLFSHAAGDIDARLEDVFCSTVLDTSTSTSNNEQLSWQNNGSTPIDVHLIVYNYPQQGCFAYDLDVDIQIDPCSGLGSDQFEENDSCGAASSVGLGTFIGLNVSKTDPDFYEFDVPAGATLTATALFQHASADVDIYLYDPSVTCGNNSNYLTRGFSSTDDEVVSWTNGSFGPKTYVLEVQVYANSAGDCADYILGIDPGQSSGVGQNYCGPAVQNSTGVPGVISAQGSAQISANDLTLIASSAPPTSLGYFLVSRTAGFVPNPGGSTGHLCLLPPFGRYLQFAGPVSANGTRTLSVDLTMIPQPTSLVAAQSGETWYFQFWHRDSLIGIPTSNFTDGIGITFQ